MCNIEGGCCAQRRQLRNCKNDNVTLHWIDFAARSNFDRFDKPQVMLQSRVLRSVARHLSARGRRKRDWPETVAADLLSYAIAASTGMCALCTRRLCRQSKGGEPELFGEARLLTSTVRT